MTSLAYLFFPPAEDPAPRSTHRRVATAVTAIDRASDERTDERTSEHADVDAMLAETLQHGADDAACSAFELLYRTYYARLVEYATSMTASVDTARDVAADVFLSLWNNRRTFHPKHSVRAYLFGAVRHRALNVSRAARRADKRYEYLNAVGADAVIPAPAESPDARVVAAESTVAMDALLARLSPYARSVLVFRARDGMGYDEIAAVLGTSADAVRKQFFRTIALVREWIAAQGITI